MTSGRVPKLTLRQERAAFIRDRGRLQDRVADQITAFSGSMAFVYLHVVWFALWCIGNLIWWRFDPFPFGLLTLIVSLEAIFLSTFVLLSQNRESARSDQRAEIDFETNVLSEVWLEAVAEKLGVDPKQVHATAKDRIAQSKALASADGS
jgi:uncharacterized membrane protein